MENNRYAYCPNCGSRNIQTLENGRKWNCPDCSYIQYNNVASAVGLILQDSKGLVLMERRAREPRKGFLALPGGFCEPDESCEEAAVRECIEETGIKPRNLEYLCSFPNTYLFRDLEYKTCDIFFTASLPAEYTLSGQDGETEAFEWVRLDTMEQVRECPLAFESSRKTLELWLKKRQQTKQE